MGGGEGTPEPAGSRVVYTGGWVRVEVEEWSGIGSWEVVRRRDASGVLPITPAGDVLLVKQFRPPIRRVLLEIPAGVMDIDGEDALTCSARELFEETGYRHESIELLGGYYSSAGSSDEYVHLFIARTRAGPERGPEAGIEVVRLPLEQMAEAARAGRVRDAKTAMALLLATNHPSLL